MDSPRSEEIVAEPVIEAAAEPPPAAWDGRLHGHLRLPGAIALAITIVVGSGALVLPGIAYYQVGDAALYSWASAAVVTVPLLVMFARLGAAHPGAGGVAGFVQVAFGRHLAAGIEVLLLGTFGLGIPAIALTGGNYLIEIPGLRALSATIAAITLLAVAAGVVFAGVRLSARVQVVLAIASTLALLAIGLVGVLHGTPARHLPPLSTSAITDGVMATGSVFFAFTGWEMLSFTTEEYADPRRDFPRAVVLSFLTVVVMYVLLALAVQAQLPRAADATLAAPVQAVIGATVSRTAGQLIAVLGVVIIMANLTGAVWGASRLVMSSAREGLLPAGLADLGSGGNPRRAVITVATGFAIVIVVTRLGWLGLATLLTVAGRNFFLLYLLCAGAYTRLFGGRERVFGVAATIVLAIIAATTFGPAQLGYAAVLIGLGTATSATRLGRGGRGSGRSDT
jgi:amino acid efflux transporter